MELINQLSYGALVYCRCEVHVQRSIGPLVYFSVAFQVYGCNSKLQLAYLGTKLSFRQLRHICIGIKVDGEPYAAVFAGS